MTPTNSAQRRDAINLEGELEQFFYFDGRQRYFKVGYLFENNWARGDDWDYLSHTVGGAFFTPIAWEVTTYLFGYYTIDKSFQNTDSVIGTRRDDSHQYYGIVFSRPIIDGITLSVHYTYRKNSSNQAFFQYNKHLAGVTFGFNI